jgi:hypothetical protein
LPLFIGVIDFERADLGRDPGIFIHANDKMPAMGIREGGNIL